jgi:D-3-phosphoglycerate dehydrogenase
MTKVLLTDSALKTEHIGEAIRLLASNGCELVYEQISPGDEARLYPHLGDAFAAITGGSRWEENLFARAARMRIVARAGAGYDKVDLSAATRHGVIVTNTPGAMAVSVAEFSFALMACLSKALLRNDRVVRSGQWERISGIEMAGETLGVVGMGFIGKELIKRASAFEMKIVACDPVWDRQFASTHRVARVELDELLGVSDFVSLHLPLNEKTHTLFDRDRLARMKKTAFLVNTSRGAVLDERALFEALRDRRIAGAGLDVYATEPAGADNPLLALENVVLSPHTSANTPKSIAAIALQAARNVVQAVKGEVPTDLVNRDVLHTRAALDSPIGGVR